MAEAASAQQAASATAEDTSQQRAGRRRRTSAEPQRAQQGASAATTAAPTALDSLSRLQQLADASPQAAQLRRLQALAEASPQAAQLRRLQALADASPQAAQLRRLQALADAAAGVPSPTDTVEAAPPNRTGLPDGLKAGVESLSGLSMDHVRVHYNSAQPAQLNALAYARGGDIYLAPGQEQHLPHEAWHVVQQAQGRVRPTMQMKDGVQVNDDAGLEREADLMGAKALANPCQTKEHLPKAPEPALTSAPIQRTIVGKNGENIWAESVAQYLYKLTAKEKVLMDKICLLHSLDTEFIVESVDDLIRSIGNKKYDGFFLQSEHLFEQSEVNFKEVDRDFIASPEVNEVKEKVLKYLFENNYIEAHDRVLNAKVIRPGFDEWWEQYSLHIAKPGEPIDEANMKQAGKHFKEAHDPRCEKAPWKHLPEAFASRRDGHIYINPLHPKYNSLSDKNAIENIAALSAHEFHHVASMHTENKPPGFQQYSKSTKGSFDEAVTDFLGMSVYSNSTPDKKVDKELKNKYLKHNNYTRQSKDGIEYLAERLESLLSESPELGKEITDYYYKGSIPERFKNNVEFIDYLRDIFANIFDFEDKDPEEKIAGLDEKFDLIARNTLPEPTPKSELELEKQMEVKQNPIDPQSPPPAAPAPPAPPAPPVAVPPPVAVRAGHSNTKRVEKPPTTETSERGTLKKKEIFCAFCE